MINKKTYISFLLLILCVVWQTTVIASDQIPAPHQKQPIALIGGTIHPVSGPVIENGTILFDKGKIVELGTDINIPPGAIKIDISGKHVYPGLIESNSVLGLMEINAARPTRDIAETGAVNPNVRAEVAVNPESERIPVTRSNGIACAVPQPSGGLISGKAALIMLDGWTWEDMTLKAPVGMVINWPSMTISTAGTKEEIEKQTEQIKKQIETIENAFREARAYKTARESAGKEEIPFLKTDVRWEAMLPVLRNKLPVWVRANTLREITAAVEWADREQIKMVLVGGADSPRAIDLLKRKNIPVIVTPVLRLPNREDAEYDEPFTIPAKLHDAGIKFCIASGDFDNANERNLPYHAATASAFGLPREEALKAITLYPAEIIGIANRIGSLEKGKDATLIITTGDPMEITTQVEKLYIQGRDVDLNNRQLSLYHKYQEKYKQKSGE